MGRSSMQDLVIGKQSISGITGLARMNGRYGFRCHVDHVAEVYAMVKPNSAFLPQGRKDNYLMGPAPFGTIKTSIEKVLKELVVGRRGYFTQFPQGLRSLECYGRFRRLNHLRFKWFLRGTGIW